MLSVTLKRIEHAIAVYDHDGVTNAARALNVSQPSLSVSISQLESELGRALFVRRKGRGIMPTSFGMTFLKDAKALIGQTRLLMDQDEAHDQLSGNLVFGCFDDLAPFYLPRIDKTISSKCPGISMSFVVCGFDNLARDLDHGTVDLALTYDLGLGEQIERHIVRSVVPHALVARAHRFASRSTISLLELAEEPLILTSQALSWQHILDLFNTRGIEPHVGFKTNSFELQRSFVGNCLGVAVCYANPSAPETYDGQPLRVLPISDTLTPQNIVLAHARHNPPTVAIRKVIDLVHNAINGRDEE